MITTNIFDKEVILDLSSLASRFAIITDDTIAPLYGDQLNQTLLSSGLESYLFSFPHGEKNKTREMKECIENQLFEKGLGQDTCIIALGGGVVTDLGGFIAATYCRGIPLVMIPTTLLGMVDASIGGKTGVNVSYGKNMIGCIYQPKRTLIDPSFLKSLPKKELLNGIVETIKHGIVADSQYIYYHEKHANELLNLDSKVVEKTIIESCRIKIEIVEQDKQKPGKRNLLNFGHTVGHALEQLTNYSISHGHAVAIGILVESYLSVEIGKLSKDSFDRIENILHQYSIPLELSEKFPVKALMDAMCLDKKSLKGVPRFVVIDDIGSSATCNSNYCTDIPPPILNKALHWMNHDLCCH